MVAAIFGGQNAGSMGQKDQGAGTKRKELILGRKEQKILGILSDNLTWFLDRFLKNMLQVKHAYIRTMVQVRVLVIISHSCSNFTLPELRLYWSDFHEMKNSV